MAIPINGTFETRGDGYPLINAKDVAMPDGKRLSEIDTSNGGDGLTPFIGANGNWWIGEEDTGVKAQGEKGDTGSVGAAGKDGISATHSWNGTTLTITSASGTSSANLKGEKGDKGDTGATGAAGKDGANGKDGAPGAAGKDGADGLTPVKGTDYFTEADKSEMIAAVLAALPAAEGVSF